MAYPRRRRTGSAGGGQIVTMDDKAHYIDDTPFNRETQEVYSNVEEETADVFIMLVQLFAIFNPHELVNITKIVWDKLDRLKDNLDKEAAKQEASDAGKK